ncbi:MAG: hypothetical protein B6245_10045 [Desulfobacteraceae bacterium 4572_88]|nr:MAG: hypothetical protein B6245_10045 [Desulfobacteraceae bacterium 4572_88]
MAAIQEAIIYDEEVYEEKVRHPDRIATLRLVPASGQGTLDELPAEDGIPLESNWHRTEMNLLIDSLHWHWRDRRDYFAGGNMFVYFSSRQVRNEEYRGPDFFVVKNTDGTANRKSWIVWEERGRYPDVIVELASPTTIDNDLGFKKNLYERTFRTQEYFCYDPVNERLSGWELVRGRYEEIQPDSRGRLLSRELGVRLGTWRGEYLRVRDIWLRFYIDEEQLVLTAAEAEAQRAEAADQRARSAEAEVARLQALLTVQNAGAGATSD